MKWEDFIVKATLTAAAPMIKMEAEKTRARWANYLLDDGCKQIINESLNFALELGTKLEEDYGFEWDEEETTATAVPPPTQSEEIPKQGKAKQSKAEQSKAEQGGA